MFSSSTLDPIVIDNIEQDTAEEKKEETVIFMDHVRLPGLPCLMLRCPTF